MKTALLLIATGPSYVGYIQPLLASAQKYFVQHTPFLWTDTVLKFTEHQFFLTDRGYPNTTLLRYHTFYEYAGMLSNFDQLFYCDIDMLFVAPIEGGEIFSKGITATIHPGFARDRWDLRSGDFVSTRGTPERREISTAYIPPFADNQYFCGGFNGGSAIAYLKMADHIRKNVDADRFTSNVIAKWHDESHLNRYLYDNPPAKILTPSFCYPEDYNGGYGWAIDEFEPKLLALNKEKAR